ncbi:hypothetical protein EN816_00590 [Mesorhizobium sp. M8A.F.Ca.ET.173.01.1.1]|nr:hypothetical protein EN816_00590 [Mesorhizobium sp. M8A.F.Ca.ET.173.01.1.1]
MTSPAHVDIEALAARLNKRADHTGMILTDPPQPHPDAALLREAASALLAIKADNERLERKVQAFRNDGLVQAAIARQGVLQDERDEAIARAESAMGGTAVKVKQLEWKERPWAMRQWAASSVAGDYFAGEQGGVAVWNRLLEQAIPAESLEAAKAAAQADFATRIRSCLAPGNAEPVAERLYDDDAPMADGEVRMTAAEDVLAWLLIEKIGVPDDRNYTPKEAQDTIAGVIDGLRKYEAAALAHPAPAKGVSEASREDIARVLFEQRQTPFDWDDGADQPESDAGTLRSICLDDADAVLAALSGTGKAVEGWKPIDDTTPHACHVLATRFDHDCGEWVVAVVLSPPIYPFTHWAPLPASPSTGSQGNG